MIGKIRPSECLDEEKTQSSGTTLDRSWRELAVAKQVNLVLANMFWAEAIWRTVEVLREIFYGVDIRTDGVLSVVAALELVQAAGELELGQAAAVPVLGHPRARLVLPLGTKSVTTAHRPDLVPLLAGEDLVVAAETTREPVAAEAVIAWEVAG